MADHGEKMISQIRNCIIESHRAENSEMVDAIMRRFESAFEGAMGGFRSGLSNAMVAEAAPAARPVLALVREEEEQAIRNEDERSSDNQPVVKLRSFYKDLHAFHRHWYGEGRNDEWSIAKLEETTNGRWRQQFTTGEKIQFSKASRIIGAIKGEAKRNNRDVDGVISEWNDAMMEAKHKFSLSGMVKWLAEMGFVTTKKPRGTNGKK